MVSVLPSDLDVAFSRSFSKNANVGVRDRGPGDSNVPRTHRGDFDALQGRRVARVGLLVATTDGRTAHRDDDEGEAGRAGERKRCRHGRQDSARHQGNKAHLAVTLVPMSSVPQPDREIPPGAEPGWTRDSTRGRGFTKASRRTREQSILVHQDLTSDLSKARRTSADR